MSGWPLRGIALRLGWFEEDDLRDASGSPLRGIALGHKKWTLTDESIMAHGWVDDIEGRILSIKYGPTEEEETDVEIPRDVPVLKMSLGDKSMIRLDTQVFVGAQKNEDGKYVAAFIFVGTNGNSPAL